MITGSLWPTALTVVFVAAALIYVVQASSAPDWQRRGVWVLHALAGVAMAAMLWPVGMAVSPLVYLLFFTACGLFVVFVGVFYDLLEHWRYHATMMAAMALMPVMMTAPAAAAAPMPTMSQHTQHMAMAANPAAGTATPVWLRASSAAAAGLLLASALWWFYVLIRGPQRPCSHALMAIGMGAYFALCA